MNTGGFGFSFGNFGNDDENDKNNENNKNNGNNGSNGNNANNGGGNGDNPFASFGPFSSGDGNFSFIFGGNGAGGDGMNAFAGALNQFGEMLSGMGQSMDEDSQEILSPKLIEQALTRALGPANKGAANESTAVDEATRLAELWIDEATVLPTSSATPQSWNARQWADATLPFWLRLTEPVKKASTHNMPGQEEMPAQIMPMLMSFTRMSESTEFGASLATLAESVLGGTDFGFPAAPDNTIGIVAAHVAKVAKDLNVPAQDAMVYVCAREAARQRLFKHVPWLIERLISSCEEYAAAMVVDFSEMQQKMQDLGNPDSPEAIHNLMDQLRNMELKPRVYSNNAQATNRLRTILALVEGWVDAVVLEALSPRLPSTTVLARGWQHRRDTGGSSAEVLENMTGCVIDQPPTAQARELWLRVTNAVGIERRDAAWDHPDFLPTLEQIANPASFIDTLLDDSMSDDFDPIAEIDALEKKLKEQGEIDPEQHEE